MLRILLRPSVLTDCKFITGGLNGVLAAHNRYVRSGVDKPGRSAVFHATGQSLGILASLDTRIADYFSDYNCESETNTCTHAEHAYVNGILGGINIVLRPNALQHASA